MKAPNSEFDAEFLQGWFDCKDGKPAQKDTDAYNRGYGMKFEQEQKEGSESEYISED